MMQLAASIVTQLLYKQEEDTKWKNNKDQEEGAWVKHGIEQEEDAGARTTAIDHTVNLVV